MYMLKPEQTDDEKAIMQMARQMDEQLRAEVRNIRLEAEEQIAEIRQQTEDERAQCRQEGSGCSYRLAPGTDVRRLLGHRACLADEEEAERVQQTKCNQHDCSESQ